MNFVFDPSRGLSVVRAELWGPSGSAVLQLALDTGATTTLVNVGTNGTTRNLALLYFHFSIFFRISAAFFASGASSRYFS